MHSCLIVTDKIIVLLIISYLSISHLMISVNIVTYSKH
ncbi:hypothetical protein CPT_Mangalyan_171 [Escherichia phage Mangalyan]|nr:hypothetical protein CPT_Mangalyan_171 [Escherichia phage Mangalyan]